jgi:hypothetical protein
MPGLGRTTILASPTPTRCRGFAPAGMRFAVCGVEHLVERMGSGEQLLTGARGG